MKIRYRPMREVSRPVTVEASRIPIVMGMSSRPDTVAE
jgi:hypothetical protein